jgi:outer membrane immunogenic protein
LRLLQSIIRSASRARSFVEEGKMRRLVVALLASSALSFAAQAADLPVKAPISPPPVVLYNWTGFYAGGHIGGGWVTQSSKFVSTTGVALDPVGTTYGTNRSGFLGGGQIGYNYQIQNWVLGVAGDFSWTRATADSLSNGSLLASTIHSQGKTDWYATVTGRVGYAMNNWLFYAKGGGAWVHDTYGGYAIVAGATTTNADVKSTRSGWTVGGGVEWGFWDKWTAFVEYDYIDVGTKTITFSSSAGTTSNYDVDGKFSLVKGGVNYRF